MDFRQLDYFIAVVETGSFYAAADKHFISQSAISQQIKKLETELGVALLHRHNRSFSLTPAGQVFYDRARQIQRDLQDLIQTSQALGQPTSCSLSLGVFQGYEGDELGLALAKFSQNYPQVDVHLQIQGHDSLYQGMEEGRLDLAFNDQRRAFSSSYNNVILGQSQTYLALSPNNPASQKAFLRPADLKNLTCRYVLDPANPSEEETYYRTILGLSSPMLAVKTLQEAKLKALANQGYLLVDCLKPKKQLDGLVLVPLLVSGETFSKNYCAFWKKTKTNPYIQAFVDSLQEILA